MNSLKLLVAASIIAVVFTAVYYLIQTPYYSYPDHVLSFAIPIPPLFSSAFLGLYIASIILVYYIVKSVKALALVEQGYKFLLLITRASYITWLVSVFFAESPLPRKSFRYLLLLSMYQRLQQQLLLACICIGLER